MLHLKLTKLIISPGRNGNYVSPLVEEIATTLQMMNDDAESDSAVFNNIYLSSKSWLLRKYINIRKSKKKKNFKFKKKVKFVLFVYYHAPY